MKLNFQTPQQTSVDIISTKCIIAGWAGRDLSAIEHHIEELQELGVPRPSSVPLFYRVAANQLTQDTNIEVVGTESSGEAEVLVFSHNNELFISLASDHTDRKLEAYSVALSKQICVKPVAAKAWKFSDVANHWDQLQLRSWIEEDGKKVLYQEGTVASLLHPLELIEKHFGTTIIPQGYVMTCGTVTVIGGIRPAPKFTMQLHDPVLNRTIEHSYNIDCLPEIS